MLDPSPHRRHTGGEPEFTFTDGDFRQIRQLLYQHAGISLNDGKKYMVYSRLARRLRARGLRSFQDYLAWLELDQGEEWEAFINSLTTNLTAFFREPYHFPILADLARGLPRQRPFRLWCCAASTGEEPYSIAMTLVDAFGTFAPRVEILATDIDTSVLSKAEAGIYALERLDRLPRETVRRFFLRGRGRWEGCAKVRRELRQLITFRRLNLLEASWPLQGPFDAIFCRNVMIYFDKSTQYRILARFTSLLEPHGLLFAGHAESLFHAADLFRLRGQTVYELAQAEQPRGRPGVRPSLLTDRRR